ncbi:hypothetical protein PSAC2689_70008 [Paraburkholderia sacchari]
MQTSGHDPPKFPTNAIGLAEGGAVRLLKGGRPPTMEAWVAQIMNY